MWKGELDPGNVEGVSENGGEGERWEIAIDIDDTFYPGVIRLELVLVTDWLYRVPVWICHRFVGMPCDWWFLN